MNSVSSGRLAAGTIGLVGRCFRHDGEGHGRRQSRRRPASTVTSTGPRPVNAMCVTPFDEDDRLDEEALGTVVDGLAVSASASTWAVTARAKVICSALEIDRLYQDGGRRRRRTCPRLCRRPRLHRTDQVIEAALAAVAPGSTPSRSIRPARAPWPYASPAELERFYADVLAAVTPRSTCPTGGHGRLPVPISLLTDHRFLSPVTALNISDPDLDG